MTPNQIIDRIIQNGFEVYIVGGAVRDRLLGIESNDIDIATNAKYEQLRKIFHDVKADEVGKNFQVAMISGIEIATYRVDSYDVNRNLTHTIPVSSIQEDLARRDLTINSMALNPITNEIIDPFNGQYDLKHGIIKFTGNPDERIQEDPIRMIRACRFLALIDRARFDEETFNSIRKKSSLIQYIPTERIRKEIIKAMKAKNAGNFFRALNNTNILQYVFPTMLDTIGHDGSIHHNETVFDHCCMACDEIKSNNHLLKITAFIHDIGKPLSFLLNSNGSFRKHDVIGKEIAEKELKSLKFSNNEIKYITFLIENHMHRIEMDSTDKSIRKLLVKLESVGIDYRDFVALTIADHDSNLKHEKHPDIMYDNIIRKIENVKNVQKTFSIKDLEISGNDVMEILNIKPGKKVGNILKNVFERVIDYPKLNNREKLIEMIEELK
jgi:tRNA nucleotidyltransferase (CCA-adding enzyme)